MKALTVIGGGLAGCEAAWAAANLGVSVKLYEMKPHRFSPAHSSQDLGELVCSNSLKAKRLNSASGLLKEEMRRMNSVILKAAEGCEVEAGGALAVDRALFSQKLTSLIAAHPLIEVIRGEVTEIPRGSVSVTASGPLCDGALAEDIKSLVGGMLSFYDAEAPIVTAESLDMTRIFAASRYGRGGDDYLNCPFSKAEYEAFHTALESAETAPLHGFDTASPKVYEGCMPIEVLAKRGKDAIRFGPMKPIGLTDPSTGHRPWAAVQLRAENASATLYNLVGFQTNLKFGEQKRVFGMIPGLENAEYARYGVMHRNTFLDSPRLLSRDMSLRNEPDMFFAGQITGVEGYTESAMCGIIAGTNAARRLIGCEPLVLPVTTMSGALLDYAVTGGTGEFQPMGANFGILPTLGEQIRDKQERYNALAQRALCELDRVLQ